MHFLGAFNSDTLLKGYDDEVFHAINKELNRQESQVELIASENFVSLNVLSAIGSVLTNKYAEGYPGRRYYGGCEFVDEIESLAIKRACKIFNCNYANVQPHSGSQANFGVYFALLNPGDSFLGMELDMGGHLTHGSKVSVTGKWFNSVSYGIDEHGFIDYDQVRRLAIQTSPRLIVCGASAYSRKIDFLKMREIADEVGAWLMADIAHYAGLIAAGLYPSPFPHAHIVTSTTHKTLRGPRGGLILTNDEKLAKKIDSAIFPGIQGGPQMHTIAGKAVAFGEVLKPEFKQYAQNVVDNAKALCSSILRKGLKIVSGTTDCHMMIVDLSDIDINGKEAERMLDISGITCNKNAIPNDPLPPTKTSGIRLGTAAMTTRGLGQSEFDLLGNLIFDVLVNKKTDTARQATLEICKRFPYLSSNVGNRF